MVKSIFKEIIIVLIVVIPLALITNSLRSDGLNLFETRTLVLQPAGADSPVQAITLDKVIEKYRRGEEILFVDARSLEDYVAGHIRGASNLPDHNFDEWIDAFLSRTNPDIEIIAYCDGEDCPQGHNVAEKLYQLGFEKVSYLTNGWDKWQENSLPIATGRNQNNREK